MQRRARRARDARPDRPAHGLDGQCAPRGHPAGRAVADGVLAGRRSGSRGCRAPVQHALPLPVASDQIVPGVASIYATTCGGCPSSCSLLVKQRDGRPIKIEGNDASPLTGGGTCAAGPGQRAVALRRRAAARADLDGAPRPLGPRSTVASAPSSRRPVATPRKVVLLTGTVTSPSTRALLDELRATHSDLPARRLRPGLADRAARGEPPVVRRRRWCRTTASTWRASSSGSRPTSSEPGSRRSSSRASTRRARRKDARRSFHVQFESGLSVTGSNADLRVAVAPSELGPTAVALLAAVARRRPKPAFRAELADLPAPPASIRQPEIDRIADALCRHRGESLVVSGSDDLATQIVVNALNVLLDNIGTHRRSRPPVAAAAGGRRRDGGADRRHGARQRRRAHRLGREPRLRPPGRRPRSRKALSKVTLSVSLADRRDETSALRPRRLPRPSLPRVVGRRRAGAPGTSA